MEKLRAVLPKPPDLWSKRNQHILLALFFVFSIAWALEQCVISIRFPFSALLMAHISYMDKSNPL
jgi:hypothetical protein